MIFDKLINRAVDKKFSKIEQDIKILKENQFRYREDLDIGLDGIIVVFEQKLESLGYKKSIVTDLLKKIAKLEGKNVQP